MSNKEQILKLLDIVPDYKLGYVLAYIQGITAGESSNSPLADVTQDVPDADELEALNAYKNGDTAYQPSVSHEELKKQLGL